MTQIRLTNSKTRKKEDFTPIDPNDVRMYVCGPTVYDRAHLGNARPAIVFDVLFRLLRHEYGPDHVTYVRNFTDVDDKINAKAAETGRPIAEITAETTQWYLDDMAAVGVLEPTHMPRATNYIAEMVAMIETLMAPDENGVRHAYEAEGHVLFDVDSWKDGYGKLSGRSVDDMIAGARVEVAPYKRNPMDFVLWKPSGDDQPGWDSPWGRGRPGWHIECSAMSKALLGEVFDIHGGGNDLMFPHHENEIAQSCCANGTDRMANIWLHNEMLQVEGKKMSKSLGNFFTVRDLLDGHDGQPPVPGEVIRLVMLSTHYRKPMDWTEKKRQEAEKTLKDWINILQKHGYSRQTVKRLKETKDWAPDAEFLGVLSNDLNTPGALARMHVMAKARTAAGLVPFAYAMELLGLVTDWGVLDLSPVQDGQIPDWAPDVIDRLIAQRSAARENKNWAEADRLRDVLSDVGVQVTDVAGTASWLPGPNFDPAKLEALK